jgi:hypothetical protein
MWIKTYTGDLFTSDYFCAIFLTGPYATNDEAKVYEQEDEARFARELKGDFSENSAPSQRSATLWAIVGEPKTPEGSPGRGRHVLLGYGPQGAANTLREEISNAIWNKAEAIDASEVLVQAGYTIPTSEGDQIAIAARGDLFTNGKLDLFNPR